MSAREIFDFPGKQESMERAACASASLNTAGEFRGAFPVKVLMAVSRFSKRCLN
jgi:hypothetical protein